MKTIKRKAAMLLLASFLVLSMLGLAACGKKSTKDIVTAATEKANNAKSMTYDMDMEMAMSIMEQEMTMKMYGSGEMINEPVQLSMIMNMDISAAGNSQANLMKIYATKEDDDFVVYMGAGTGEDDIFWSKTTEDASTLNQYNARESLDIYVDAAESFKETETEKINEKNATKYEGVITGDAVNKVIQESGVMEQFSSMGIHRGCASLSTSLEEPARRPPCVDIRQQRSLQHPPASWLVLAAALGAGRPVVRTHDLIHADRLVGHAEPANIVQDCRRALALLVVSALVLIAYHTRHAPHLPSANRHKKRHCLLRQCPCLCIVL